MRPRLDSTATRSWVGGVRTGMRMRFALFKKVVLSAVLLGCVLGLGGFGILRWHIGSSLDRLCAVAQVAHPHPGDDAAALVAYVMSDSHTLRARNRAIWALGQLRDGRALPALLAAHTGEPCDHQENLCQHELHKAIKLCRGETPDLLGLRGR